MINATWYIYTKIEYNISPPKMITEPIKILQNKWMFINLTSDEFGQINPPRKLFKKMFYFLTFQIFPNYFHEKIPCFFIGK